MSWCPTTDREAFLFGKGVDLIALRSQSQAPAALLLGADAEVANRMCRPHRASDRLGSGRAESSGLRHGCPRFRSDNDPVGVDGLRRLGRHAHSLADGLAFVETRSQGMA